MTKNDDNEIFFINMDIRVSLDVPRLISQTLKLTII
jgi:hypothetical protein